MVEATQPETNHPGEGTTSSPKTDREKRWERGRERVKQLKDWVRESDERVLTMGRFTDSYYYYSVTGGRFVEPSSGRVETSPSKVDGTLINHYCGTSLHLQATTIDNLDNVRDTDLPEGYNDG